MSLYRLCHPTHRCRTRLLDILRYSGSPLVAMCERANNHDHPVEDKAMDTEGTTRGVSDSDGSNKTSNNNSSSKQSHNTWRPFDPVHEKTETLMSWLMYRDARTAELDSKEPSLRETLLQLVRSDFTKGPVPGFAGFIQFNSSQVSTDFLKRWLAQHHLSNGVEAKPRSWWISKASTQQTILQIMLGAGSVDDTVTRNKLRGLFVQHESVARSARPLVEVLLAFETTVLDTMTSEQLKIFTHSFEHTSEQATSSPVVTATSTALQNANTKVGTKKGKSATAPKARLVKNNNKSKAPSKSIFALVDEHKTLSMLGLLVLASLMKMGVTFMSSDAKDTMIASDTASGWSPEDIVIRGQGALAAAAQANHAAVLKTSLLNTSVDEFARYHKIKFLAPGTVSRYAFNLALKGDARGVVGQTGLQLLSQLIPVRANDSIPQRITAKVVRDQLQHSLLQAVKKF